MRIDKSIKENVSLGKSNMGRNFVQANKEFLMTRYYNELSDLEKELEKLAKIPDGEINEEELIEKTVQLKNEIKEIETKLEDIEKKGKREDIDIIWQY